MITVTRITTQKKSDERFNIFIDQGNGEEFGFSIDQDVLIKFGLKKGKTFDEDELQNLLHEDHIKKGFNLALVYLSYRMRSTKEIFTYLQKKEFEPSVIQAVISRLAHYKYVDDLEFAKAFVRSKSKTSSKGPLLIKQELIEKGISQAEITKSLGEYSREEQVDTIVEFAEKKVKQYKKFSETEAKQKLSQLLLNKGFSIDTIQEGMSHISIEKDEEEKWEAIKHHAVKAHRKYVKKYQGWEYEQRMKQALYRRGFQMSEIEEVLNELRNDDSF